MKTYCFTTLAAAALLGTGLGSAHADILNETWADGDRTNQALPDSAGWYSSQADGLTLTATTNSLTQAWDGVSGSGQVHAFFTDSGVVSLEVGETMRLTYQISFTNLVVPGAAIRVGLFNTTNTTPRITGDGTNVFVGASGYMVHLPFITTGTTVDIRRRNGPFTTTQQLMTALPAYTGLGTGEGGSLSEDLVSNTNYTGVFEVTRFDTNVNIRASLSRPEGTNQVVLYDFVKTNSVSTRLWSEFDTVAFAVFWNAADSFTLHSVQIGVIEPPSPPPGAPVIAGWELSGGNIVLSVTNGQPSNFFDLLSAADLTPPIVWMTNNAPSTLQFDVNGVAVVTNAAAQAQEFFKIQETRF